MIQKLKRKATSDARFPVFPVTWDTYERLVSELGQSHIRMTYDRGALEFMAPSFRHEHVGRRIGRLIDIMVEEFDIKYLGGGSTTFRRKDLERGLEPDECYYFENHVRILGKDDIDLSVDPPPDLAIEMDITHSSLDRMSIYASIGVPEIWRYTGSTIQLYRLAENGEYELSETSGIFHGLNPAVLMPFANVPIIEELAFARRFRAWVRKELLPRWKGKPTKRRAKKTKRKDTDESD